MAGKSGGARWKGEGEGESSQGERRVGGSGKVERKGGKGESRKEEEGQGRRGGWEGGAERRKAGGVEGETQLTPRQGVPTGKSME